MAGSKWDSLYRTSCEEPEILDRDGLCSTMDELVFGCSVIEETEWVQSARTKRWNNRYHNCIECKTEFVIDGSVVEHSFPPNEGKGNIVYEQTCHFPDCSEVDDNNRCLSCHFFPYPLESPWDGPEGLFENPLDLGIGTVVTLDNGDWYFPLNIFYNKKDMKCTMDCRNEGRNYVNPFYYNP